MLDIYTHILPDAFTREMDRVSPGLGNIAARLRKVAPLHDLAARFRAMDAAGEGYRQVISLPNPPIEEFASGPVARDLAGIANDAMADLCARHPDRFPAFVAAASLDDVDAALAEIERAATRLRARGAQVFTNVAGR